MAFMHWMPRKHRQMRYSLSSQVPMESRGAVLRIHQIRSSKVMISLAVKRENIAILNGSVRVNGLAGKQGRSSNTRDPASLAFGIWIIIYHFGSSYGNTAQVPHLEWIHKNKKQSHHLVALKILIICLDTLHKAYNNSFKVFNSMIGISTSRTVFTAIWFQAILITPLPKQLILLILPSV